jgi:hypothetical protein
MGQFYGKIEFLLFLRRIKIRVIKFYRKSIRNSINYILSRRVESKKICEIIELNKFYIK